MKKGYYGQWGGAFIPEVLQATFVDLNRAYEAARADASFWQEYVDFDIDPERHVEICIGLLNEDEEFDRLFARMLLSRHPDERHCQVQWQQR